MGFLAYIVCWIVIWCFYLWGILRLSFKQLLLFTSSSIFINLFFYLMFKTGLNKKFRDPSLTLPQVWTGTLFVMFTLYFTNDHRGILLILYFIAFVFGVFKFDKKEFMATVVFALLSYTTAIMLLWWNHPDLLDPKIDILQGLVLLVSLLWFSMMGDYISQLRKKVFKSYAELSVAYKKMEEMASLDFLTQIPNRRSILQYLQEEKDKVDRYKYPLSICLCDIDFFKVINDSFGHAAGDLVLKVFAHNLSECLRKADKVGRYGGEEFLIILPHTDLKSAVCCIDRCRSRIASISFPEIPIRHSITASFGVCEYKPGESIDDTLSRVDKALYEAKFSGRNKICSIEHP